MYIDTYIGMNKPSPGLRRVTANLPAELLERACRTSGKGITETLVEGLDLVQRTAAAKKALRLKGKLRLEVDLERSRERAGR